LSVYRAAELGHPTKDSYRMIGVDLRAGAMAQSQAPFALASLHNAAAYVENLKSMSLYTTSLSRHDSEKARLLSMT
jgi:hypothetical protein